MKSVLPEDLTFLIAVRNARATIGAAINSLLWQTIKGFAIVVVDDHSTDGTFEFLEAQYGKTIELLRNQGKGIADALNTGVTRVRTKWIARLDGDDVSLPWRVEVQLNHLNKHPDLVLLGGKAVGISGRIWPSRFVADAKALRTALRGWNPIVHSTVVMRRDAVVSAGGYGDKERVQAYVDYRLWIRLCRLGPMANIDEILSVYDDRSLTRVSVSMTRRERYKALLSAQKFAAETLGDNSLGKLWRARSFLGVAFGV